MARFESKFDGGELAMGIDDRLVRASEKALEVLEEICDPSVSMWERDEQVRDELRAALAALRAAGQPPHRHRAPREVFGLRLDDLLACDGSRERQDGRQDVLGQGAGRARQPQRPTLPRVWQGA